MKSGGYLALVNPCSGHIGPQSSSSDLESSSVKDQFGAINVEEVDNSVEEDQLSADENVAAEEEEEDDGNHLHANNNNNKKSKLKRSLTLHDRKKSKEWKMVSLFTCLKLSLLCNWDCRESWVVSSNPVLW